MRLLGDGMVQLRVWTGLRLHRKAISCGYDDRIGVEGSNIGEKETLQSMSVQKVSQQTATTSKDICFVSGNETLEASIRTNETYELN